MLTFTINDNQGVELIFNGEDKRLAELNAGNGATAQDVALGAVVVQAMRLMNKKPFWELIGRIIESTIYLDDSKVTVFGNEYDIYEFIEGAKERRKRLEKEGEKYRDMSISVKVGDDVVKIQDADETAIKDLENLEEKG